MFMIEFLFQMLSKFLLQSSKLMISLVLANMPSKFKICGVEALIFGSQCSPNVYSAINQALHGLW